MGIDHCFYCGRALDRCDYIDDGFGVYSACMEPMYDVQGPVCLKCRSEIRTAWVHYRERCEIAKIEYETFTQKGKLSDSCKAILEQLARDSIG